MEENLKNRVIAISGDRIDIDERAERILRVLRHVLDEGEVREALNEMDFLSAAVRKKISLILGS